MTEPGPQADSVEAAVRVIILCIYLADLVIVIDLATDGGLRRWLSGAWATRVARPLQHRRDRTRAERQVIFEAMCILDQGTAA